MHWTAWIVLLAFIGFLITNYGAPWLVRRLSSNVRIRNIGLRSVRGLFLKFGRVTLTAERIALSIHRSAGGTRMGLDFQAAVVTIAKDSQGVTTSRPADNWMKLRQHYTRGFSVASLTDMVTSTSTTPQLTLTQWVIHKAIATCRNAVRVAAVYFLILAMRSLPALTSRFETVLDNLVVVSDDLDGAHLVVKGVTCAALLKFTQLDDLDGEDSEELKSKRRETFRLQAAKPNWRRKWQDSMRRVWEKATARTKGLISLTVDIEDVAAFATPMTPTLLAEIRSQSRTGSFAFTSSASATGFTTIEKAPPPGSCLSIEGPIHFQTSAGFNPRKMVFQKRSGEALVNLPSIQLAPDVIAGFLQTLKSTQRTEHPEPPPTNATASPSWMPVTRNFSPPGSPTLSPQQKPSRWNRVKRRPESSLPQIFFAVLKGIEVNVPVVTARMGAIQHVDSPSTSYSVVSKGFLVRLQLSEPVTSVLHQKWLGNTLTSDSKSDISVYSFAIQFRSVVARRLGTDIRDHLTLVRIGEVSVDSIFTGWPTPWMLPPRIFVADPNAGFVAVEVMVDHVELVERLATLRWLVQRFPSKHQHSALREPSGHVLHPVPRVNLQIAINNPSLRLLEQCSETTTSLTVRSDGLAVSLESTYHDTSYKKPPSLFEYLEVEGQNPVVLDHIASFHLEPLSISVSRATHETVADKKDPEWSDSSPGSGSPAMSYTSLDAALHPLVELGAVHVIAKGTTLGYYADQAFTGVSLDASSTLMQIRAVVDLVLVDLTDLEWASFAFSLLDDMNQAPNPAPKIEGEHPGIPPKPIFERLPCGYSLHLALPSIRLGVCGAGIRVDDVPTTRGLAIRSSFVADYCYVVAPHHTSRFKRNVSKAHMRDRLGLQQEATQSATAHAHEASVKDERAAFLQFAVSQTTVRCVVDDGNFGWLDPQDLDPSFCSADDSDAHVMLRIPEVSGSALLRRRRSTKPEVASYEDSCRVEVRIPRTSCRVDLHHIYCAIAVLGALKQLNRPTPHKTMSTHHAPLLTQIHVRTDVVQLLAVFPRGCRTFLRFTSLAYSQSHPSRHAMTFLNGCMWVPMEDGLWEELCRLTSWKMNVDLGVAEEDNLAIAIAGNGARIRLPHKFVVSELLTDITLTVKGSKHLKAMVSEGSVRRMDKPPVEEAKKVPPISLALGSLIFEMADDPFESKVNMIWRVGFEEQAARLQREEAFDAKVAAIRGAENGESPLETMTSSGIRDEISPHHTVDIDEARLRLDTYNAQSWVRRHKQHRDILTAKEDSMTSRIRGNASSRRLHAALPIPLKAKEKYPPLLRAVLAGVQLSLGPPEFGNDHIEDFMHDLGGLPHNTQFTLLIPLHLTWATDGFRATMRDYPVPLWDVQEAPSSWYCTSNLVIAEELGDDHALDWIDCTIVPPGTNHTSPPLEFLIPKTIMPVKTYANPEIVISSPDVTDLSWSVSCTPALQDVMRVLDTFSPTPRDKSPAIGFWDKMRLILHWRLRARFENEVRLYVKGSRDPYYLVGAGAGFVLCFEGNTTLTVGHSAQDKELIQISSDRAVLAIPDLNNFQSSTSPPLPQRATPRRLLKTCAKLTNGVRLGLGFMFERTCWPSCHRDRDLTPFYKHCRLFDFRPHYSVALRVTPDDEEPKDSYDGFRSNFIHFSISLTSPTIPRTEGESSLDGSQGYNIFHLTPKVFAHFFAWFGLFGAMPSLPIRQGTMYKDARPPSPKFGRHIATIKYRISLAPLFITHLYKQDAVEQWREGETGFVGVKAMVKTFRADLHQREQEQVVINPVTGVPKISTHKPFAMAEVVITDLQLQAVYALFADPRKALVPILHSQSASHTPPSMSFPEEKCEPMDSRWVDIDDFIETDWTPCDKSPRIWLFQAGTCPQFAYFRNTSEADISREDGQHTIERSKFGDEDTHVCLLSGRESFKHVQIQLTRRRLSDLISTLDALVQQQTDQNSTQSYDSANSGSRESKEDDVTAEISRLKQSIERLEAYLLHLHSPTSPTTSGPFTHDHAYAASMMPTSSSSDWSGFSNVYEVHSPQVILSNSTRNVLLDYYYSSSNRRGFEYHMSHRAVAFIQEQLQSGTKRRRSISRPKEPAQGAAARAATALRRILTSESSTEDDDAAQARSDSLESLPRIVQQKRHFCVLLKPQIALHCEEGHDSVVYIAAMEATLQSYMVVDLDHIDDSVNGYIMRRQYVQLHGVQAFVPTVLKADSDRCGVPLEVLVDFRCESQDYERLVPQTDASIQYDRFNRLRLHSQAGGSSSDLSESESSSTNEHMKYQTDRIKVDIPRFTVTANSESFRALQRIITHLLLYTDPTHSLRNEALETFLFTYDFADLSSAVDVVLTLQSRIRQLEQLARKFDLVYDTLNERGQVDALMVHAELATLGDKLDFIFSAIRLAQEKARNFDDNLASALQLEAASDFISWNMLGPDNNLLAKLAVKGVHFKWTNKKDSTTINVVTIKDFEALNALPTATFPEVLVAHPHPANHPMVKRKLFAEAKWTVLPPVAQISVVERFELRLHPVKVQIERKVGREIQEYISPKAKRAAAKLASPPHLNPRVRTLSTYKREEAKREESYPRHSLDSPTSLAPPRPTVSRTASLANIRESAQASTPDPTTGRHRTLNKSVSSNNLSLLVQAPSPTTPTSTDPTQRQPPNETAEMRVRAKKRTFLSIDLESFLLVLTYKGEPLNLTRRGEQGAIKARDFVPNLDEFPLLFPKFEHHHCTWSVEEFLGMVKSELKKNAVGVVFRAFNARFASKYRHGEGHRDGQTDDSEGDSHSSIGHNQNGHSNGHGTATSSRSITPIPTPLRIAPVNESPPSSRNRVFAGAPISASPTSEHPPVSLDSSTSSLAASSESDNRGHRGRTPKMFNIFRHRTKKMSTDSAAGDTSAAARPRQSLDEQSGPPPDLRPPVVGRSRSHTRQ